MGEWWLFGRAMLESSDGCFELPSELGPDVASPRLPHSQRSLKTKQDVIVLAVYGMHAKTE